MARWFLGLSPAEGGWALFASRALFPFKQPQSGRKWVSCPASLVFSTAKAPWVLLEALQLCSPPQFLQSSIQPELGLTWLCAMLLAVFLPFTSKNENTQAALPVPFCVVVQNAAVTPTGFLLGFTQLWALGALNKGIYAWTWQWQAFLLA